jgi:hypothetical protein
MPAIALIPSSASPTNWMPLISESISERSFLRISESSAMNNFSNFGVVAVNKRRAPG